MNFFDLISGTPVWVWVIFVYLIIVGVNSFRSRTVSLGKLAIMPTLFMLWSLYSLYVKCASCYYFLIIWTACAVFGVIVGGRIIQRLRVSIDKHTKLIHMPGSCIPLMLAISFFVLKYTLGVMYALDPLMRHNMLLLGFDTVISGLIAGISLGRFVAIYKTYKQVVSH